MELNQENIRKIKEIILFTAVIIVCLWKYETVLDILFFLLNILTPFILGGAIAFVLNVPMNFVQRHLFKEERIRNRKVSQKLARPVSMVLVLIAVFGIVAIVMFILIPQLGETFANLGRSIRLLFRSFKSGQLVSLMTIKKLWTRLIIWNLTGIRLWIPELISLRAVQEVLWILRSQLQKVL